MKAWRNRYNSYRLEDFLLDETFIDWIYNGKPQNDPWFDRLGKNQEQRETAEKAERILLKLRPSGIDTDHKRIEGLKDRIDAKIEAMRIQDEFGKYGSANKGSFRQWRLVGVAASLVVLITTIFVVSITSDNESSIIHNTAEVRTTKNGQKLTVHLSDGSKVKLNSGSSIKYEKYFGDSARIIHLEGEAFFDVAKDSLRPFMVYAGNTVTRALGTSFNINSSAGLSTRISLLTGRVLVKNTGKNSDTAYLTPGNMIISGSNQLGPVEEFDYAEVAWKDDVLFFQNASKEEVFETLEKWYGVSFELDKGLDNSWDYTGKFDNQSLRNVLMSIGFAEEFTFKIQNKEVVIKPMEP